MFFVGQAASLTVLVITSSGGLQTRPTVKIKPATETFRGWWMIGERRLYGDDASEETRLLSVK